jgi:Tfp pilus assembly protein PilF
MEEAERLFVVEHRSADALRLIQTVLRSQPANVRAQIVRARVFFSLGQFSKASRTLSQVLRVSPSHPEALLERARVLYALQGKNRRALQYLDMALARAGRERWLRIEIHRLRGHVYFQLDRDDEAIKAFRAALKLRPNDALLLSEIGKVLLSNGRPAPALRYLKRALSHRANSAVENEDFIFVAKAEALAALGRHWEVIAAVRRDASLIRDPIAKRILNTLASDARQCVIRAGKRVTAARPRSH